MRLLRRNIQLGFNTNRGRLILCMLQFFDTQKLVPLSYDSGYTLLPKMISHMANISVRQIAVSSTTHS